MKPPRLPFATAPVGPLPSETAISGEVLRIVFANPENGWGVLRLRRHPSNQEVTLAGQIGGVLEGMQIDATGRWCDNPGYGRQFQVESLQAVLPRSERGIERYLASGVVPGINRQYAAAIVKHFGAETLRILDEEPERLREVRGIGPRKMESIRKHWQAESAGREAEIFLEGLGISPAFTKRILKQYTPVGAPEVVRRNPYRLAEEIEGIGFLTADRIAASLGVTRDSPQRLAAGVVYTVKEAALAGHTCLGRARLVAKVCETIQVKPQDAEHGLDLALQEGKLVAETADGQADGPFYYTLDLYEAETQLAEALNLLLQTQLVDAKTRLQAEQSLGGAAPARAAITLNPEQELARQRALSHTISIITGGPGVGKTTVISVILKDALARHWRVRLAAPTGRAARRLSESAGLQATTIHRLLQFDPVSGDFLHGPDNPIPCDLLIIDECSMLDVELARDLFQAIAPGTRLILVGDRDQLPSVGPGTVLNDLIRCGRIPMTALVRIYRQREGSRIITSAHEVNAGILPSLANPPKGTRGDFYFYSVEAADRAAEFVCRLTSGHVPAFFGFRAMEDIQVLTPMRRGECGTIALNTALQQALNPPAPDKPEVPLEGRVFRLGDRVMQTKNNYAKGVFNGEMGRIVAINENAKTLRVAFDLNLVEYAYADCGDLLHAYAITIHKSQGSEFPVVIMPLLGQHHLMLQRNLLYTGMTRARKLFILVGSQKAVATAVRNNTPTARTGLLAWRIRK